jgi:hypothetical protein
MHVTFWLVQGQPKGLFFVSPDSELKELVPKFGSQWKKRQAAY